MKVKPQKKNIKFISITMTLFLKETNLSRKDAVNKVLQKELQFHLINKFKTASKKKFNPANAQSSSFHLVQYANT